MTKTNGSKQADSLPNSNLKEQDKGIMEAFAREDHRVLTNSEISEHVSLSTRQVRRRLDKLAEEEVVGKRVVSGVKLAWLEEDVKEPITVQYPLLTYVRDRASVQLLLLGIVAGTVSVLILLAAALSIGYNVPIGFISREQLLVYGVVAAASSAVLMLVAVLMAAVGKTMRYLGFDLKSQIEDFVD